MKTCNKCGKEGPSEEFRKDRNICLECKKEQDRVYYETNRTKIASKKKVYNQHNKDKISLNKKNYYKANKERVNKASRLWRKANPERSSELSRIWREANPERHAENYKTWAKANPEKVLADSRKKRALKRGATATLTLAEIGEVWKEFDGKCFWCIAIGVDRIADDLEHVVPLRPKKGGLRGHHIKGNVVPSCQPHNRGKGGKFNKDPLLFLFEIREKNETIQN